MIQSIAILIIVGLLSGMVCEKIRIPKLIGMILAGILVGPQVFQLLDESLLEISAVLRKIALIIILLRAGLTLNIADLKKVGRSAILMCFVPASIEMLGMMLLAPKLLNVTILEAAIMGAVVAAVSPAVVVPRMIKLIEDGYGTHKGIPQLILAGASADDVFVIVLFGAVTGMAQGDHISVFRFVNVPISILLGILIGIIAGYLLVKLYQIGNPNHHVKAMILMATAFGLVALEDAYGAMIPYSSLIAVMFLGIGIKKREEQIGKQMAGILNSMWSLAEIFLFVLVGASVRIQSALEYGVRGMVLIFGVMIFRMIGVLLCLIKTPLSPKERLFCVIAYLPKATVQAAIGGVPLAMGLSCGNVVLTVSVLAILITAPIGAFGMDKTYQKLLEREDKI